MEYVSLGTTGLQVSRICLGCMSYGEPARGNQPWSLDRDAAQPFFRQALDAGINFFDTANVYSLGSSEEITGSTLLSMTSRDEVVIATKVHGRMRPGPNGQGLSRKAIMSEIDHSLRRLGTEYVDRRDHGSAPRCRARGQGSLHRRVVDVRMAVRPSALHRRPQRMDEVRQHAGLLQLALSRRRA